MPVGNTARHRLLGTEVLYESLGNLNTIIPKVLTRTGQHVLLWCSCRQVRSTSEELGETPNVLAFIENCRY